MSHRKLSALGSSARRIAVPTIAATLLSATGLCVDVAVAQAPKPTTTAQAPKPAAPKPAPAPAAPKPPAAGAPAAAAPAAAAAPEGLQMPPLVYSTWVKVCPKAPDPNAKEFCITGKDGRTEQGQPIVAAALLEPAGETKRLRITLPTGLQLQFGTHLVVDQDPPLSGAFLTCFANGCMADYEATPALVDRLKKGQMLQIQAINLAGTMIPFPLPLTDSAGNSFQKANEGPPTDPKVIEEQQRKLQEDLQKRAEELRKKLEAQQGAAPK
jgi:invasion protein IalB